MSFHDFFVAPVWMAANLLVARVMWEVAGRMFPENSFVERIHATLVLGLACIVGVATLLGSVGFLSAALLLGGVTAVALIVLRIFRKGAETVVSRSEGKTKIGPDSELGRPSISTLTEKSVVGENFTGHSRIELWCWVGWCIWAALCAGRVVVSGLLEYPSNWDTLTYHLPFVDQWLCTGSLYFPGAIKWFFPGNNELVALWIVGPFSGDFLAPLNNFPCVVLLVLSAVQLGRMFGVAPLPCHLGVLALVSNYVVWHQVMDNKNDVAAVSLLFCGLVYGFRHSQKRATADLIFASICLGLLAGTKYYASLYAGAALITIVALTASTHGRRAALVAMTIGSMGLFLWGGYWYGRNLWITGAPLYPKTLFAQNDVATGGRLDYWTTTLLGNTSEQKWSLWVAALWRITGPCHVAALIFARAA